MLEARIKGVCSLFWCIACSDIHTRKYSGGHEIWLKIIKNAGGGWQLFSKTLAGKELTFLKTQTSIWEHMTKLLMVCVCNKRTWAASSSPPDACDPRPLWPAARVSWLYPDTEPQRSEWRIQQEDRRSPANTENTWGGRECDTLSERREDKENIERERQDEMREGKINKFSTSHFFIYGPHRTLFWEVKKNSRSSCVFFKSSFNLSIAILGAKDKQCMFT